MLLRFCLYGFLKNQRYFEPFLMLALLDKGLTYFQVGLLTALRAAVINLLEIPSGAAADLWGRRRALMLGFGAYALSFLVFARAGAFPALAGAMALFGVGEAFRSGSHKALIFKWLELEGRQGEKTRVYGLTRAWSKYGSALSALIAAGLVYVAADYDAAFIWSLAPAVLSLANLATYPDRVDPPAATGVSLRAVGMHLRRTLDGSVREPGLRRCLVESLGYNGLFFAIKDYAQPVLLAVAAAWFARSGAGLSATQQTALVTGPVYFVIFLGAGLASRTAHRFSGWSGGDEAAARRLWAYLAVLCGVLTLAARADAMAVVLAAFAALHVLQNWWRPILTARIYEVAAEQQGATVLSIESQAHRLGTMVLAPVAGRLVDASESLWPVAALGMLLATGAVIAGGRRRPTAP